MEYLARYQENNPNNIVTKCVIRLGRYYALGNLTPTSRLLLEGNGISDEAYNKTLEAGRRYNKAIESPSHSVKSKGILEEEFVETKPTNPVSIINTYNNIANSNKDTITDTMYTCLPDRIDTNKILHNGFEIDTAKPCKEEQVFVGTIYKNKEMIKIKLDKEGNPVSIGTDRLSWLSVTRLGVCRDLDMRIYIHTKHRIYPLLILPLRTN